MKTGELYDQLIAEHFDRDFFELNRNCRALALSQIQKNLKPGLQGILDLGMGTGEFLLALHSAYPEASLNGLEISKKMIERARDKLESAGIPEINIQFGSAEKLSTYFPNSSVDLIALHFILTYVDHSQVFQQIAQVLRPGGLFSLSTTTGKSFPTLHGLASQFTSEEFIQSQFNVPKDIEEIKDSLGEAGFEVLEGENYEKSFEFQDFDHLTDFALHSGWWANEFFLQMTPEQIGVYREFSKNFFPLKETFRAALVLTRKI